ncbi:KUP/HAK/KT family potassium transporter [Flavihumibacter cheonanensis]|uniref:KUP/HAK/KT family potassium transporter n=1 Tax=Flavihumibacter cheonanensis TaxID=1442385 RepID=UPI001EF9A95A|nr:KUP/HAK/KT family potassium transporter [Flavihumibacter cheonanensis]MCG7753343.1 KUP/HAK/KT family potassium transporter [Flavihumibacter cheonanensis]
MGSHQKLSAAGILIALGIIYGDIGTSPLYVLNAITSGKQITEELVVGALSLIIWTLTLQTTFKYVVLTLQADNRGEGGVFSLFALVRRRRKWLVIPAMIGGAALLADGMITPPISVTSAIEGLKQVPAFSSISQTTIIYIVIGILTVLFFLQQFGTAFIGKFFGPVMSVWFVMLAILGILHFTDEWVVFKAFNPYYGIHLLMTYPKGFYILGGVFLCTTGAEALYSDLGHCGKWNIRYSWILVKSCLILNYLGQGAWLLSNHKGSVITTGMLETGFNPFYGVMPGWFLYFGITIATAAAIIASQALISGSFTLISESMRLNLWPKFKIVYPTEARGQLFIPAINLLLFAGCIGIVLYFKKASNMEAAYGLAITLCMIATSILFANYLVQKRVKPVLIYLYLIVYLSIEVSFLWANMEKFTHGGYVTLIVGGGLFFIMYDWFRARKIKNRYVEFVRLDLYVPQIQELSNDKTVPRYATHLVYMTSADNEKEIEHKIIYSILFKKPKRADIYWFVHVDTLDDPYTSEYKVTHIIPNDIIRIDFRLGFRVEPRIDLFFRKVVEDLVINHEVNVTSRYESLGKNNIVGDFQFIVMEKYLSQDNELSFWEKIVMKFHFLLKEISLSEEKGFGLDPGKVVTEKFPLIVAPVDIKIKRIQE